MFINEDIVTIIFRLINFFSVIGLGVYLFNKHISSDIWDMIHKKKEVHNALLNQQTTLEKKQSELDTLLKEESLLCEQFRIKIDEWKKAVEIESNLRKKKNNEYKAVIAQRIAERARHKENARIQTIALNSLVPELQKSLSHYFDNKKHSGEYLNSIVQFMDKKT